jgi:hypothetical protein
MAGGGEGQTLEYTPTWVVAVVCSVIVLISLSVERILHYLGKACIYLNKLSPSSPVSHSVSNQSLFKFDVFAVSQEEEPEASV